MKKQATAKKKTTPVKGKPAAAAKTPAASNHTRELESHFAALNASQLVAEFRIDGTITSANDNFLRAFGYTLDEIESKHHSILLDPKSRLSEAYQHFWLALNRGENQSGEYRNVARDGSDVWLDASFAPIAHAAGKPDHVILFAKNITEAKKHQTDSDSQLKSISTYQAVIELNLDGTVITANANFLNATGYTLAEIQGRHHSLFVDPAYKQSNEYRLFWERLGRGEAEAGQYKRFRKDGSELWLQASYNPIFDAHGKPAKVIKYATDITESKRKEADAESQLKSISDYQAVIEFKLDGTIVTANANFLNATGYTLSEIQGRHHSLFVDPAYRQTPEYRSFWEKLGRGEAEAGQYKRFRKDGSEVWLQASYNPIFDASGKPAKVVKYATDITETKRKEADTESQLKSISDYQAVIEFKLDGTIVTANANFLNATGYTLSEIQGRHHSMFVDPAYRQTNEYRSFWDKLGRGEAEAGQYKRFRKDGSELWLQASYNPIFDASGKPAKVIKYATDITETKRKEADTESQLKSISQYQAVIEFRLDGTIVTANANFLNATGYTLSEIQGRHHSMFVDPAYRQTNEYRSFWEKLGRGEAESGQYRRIRKDGTDVWLQASYNPIVDANGKPTKVIKYATDITESKLKEADSESQLKSISDNQAVIEFTLDGTILKANKNFLNTMGYSLPEIQGRHHSMFVDTAHKQSNEYRLFWEKLGHGDPDAGQYKRIRKDGSEVWLQASYNPIFDANGKPTKVVKYASDITEAKRKQADLESQLKSISANQAVIEFKLDGTIVTANQNFLNATGYSLHEIEGRHHSIFVDSAFKQTDTYRQFWERLGRGEADAGQYKRVKRDGSELWLQASYNPIVDLSGKPCKVIKYATDITAHKMQEHEMERILSETSRVMKALGSGDLTDSISGQYDGEFAILRNTVNKCVSDIRKMITETSLVMKAVADGDLRQSIQENFEGEFGNLRDSVNSCINHLRTTVERIRHSVSTMTVSSSEIASGNADLSHRTEEQSTSIGTIAANMEQITQTVKQNADNAREANTLATGARNHAEKGGAVVMNAVSAMAAINEASKRIADIIGVIDEIAFQTNLLALNAAVEAARAGEQGRGFAVVASEVRNLAQRSAGAAKEIKALIKDSVGRVEEGSRLVNESGATLEQIVTAAKKVSDIVAEIAAASTEQSAGVEKVTQAVQQMDSAVQENSALVEETSACSNMMDDQTQSMSALIDFFKLSHDEASAPAAPRKETPSRTTAHSSQQKAVRRAPVKRTALAASHSAVDTMDDEF
jgi:methyl-accepting chemotaxis protein